MLPFTLCLYFSTSSCPSSSFSSYKVLSFPFYSTIYSIYLFYFNGYLALCCTCIGRYFSLIIMAFLIPCMSYFRYLPATRNETEYWPFFFYANALSAPIFFTPWHSWPFLPETFLTSTKDAADWLIALIWPFPSPRGNICLWLVLFDFISSLPTIYVSFLFDLSLILFC